MKVIDVVKSKKHILTIRSSDGKELTLGTDDLREALAITGFGARVKETERKASAESLQEKDDVYRSLAIEQQEQIKKLQGMVEQLQSELQESKVSATRQPIGGDVPVAKEEQSIGQKNIQKNIPSVLDVSPDEMRQEIWDGMSEEMRNEWMQKYYTHQ